MGKRLKAFIKKRRHHNTHTQTKEKKIFNPLKTLYNTHLHPSLNVSDTFVHIMSRRGHNNMRRFLFKRISLVQSSDHLWVELVCVDHSCYRLNLSNKELCWDIFSLLAMSFVMDVKCFSFLLKEGKIGIIYSMKILRAHFCFMSLNTTAPYSL